MSNKAKFYAEDCWVIARALVAQLTPFCEKIEVAGSLRRQKQMVSDIEIVYVPKFGTRQVDMFSKEQTDLCAVEIDHLVVQKVIAKRPAKNGVFTWGDLNKLGVHVQTGIPVDFFCEPDILDWPRTLAIRTGPKEFNVKLMASAPKVGLIPHAYGPALFSALGVRVIPKNERHFIELCGMKYLLPRDR